MKPVQIACHVEEVSTARFACTAIAPTLRSATWLRRQRTTWIEKIGEPRGPIAIKGEGDLPVHLLSGTVSP